MRNEELKVGEAQHTLYLAISRTNTSQDTKIGYRVLDRMILCISFVFYTYLRSVFLRVKFGDMKMVKEDSSIL